MLVQPKKVIGTLGTLALLDPDIPGAKLLPNGEWAINRAAALLNFPTLGMKVQIPVWSNKSLSDKLELQLNNQVVDQLTITQPAELTQRATLFVAPGRFQSGKWDLAYRVTRFNQAPEPFAPPLKLLVKLEIPAGQDTDPGQGHSNLHMEFRPPEIEQDGVDKDTAENGVEIWITAKPGSGSNLPYPGIAVGDVIWVSWGGEMVPSVPVTQAQIDDPLKNPIVIHISKDVILAVGDSGNEGLAVSFFVRDFADNDSEDWCGETRIVVDTGNSRLEAPILEPANGNELDIDQFDKEQLLLQVFAASSVDYNQGDTIIMYLQGTTLNGESVKVETRQTINKKPPLVVQVLMDNDGARALAKTQGVFFFELERGGSIIQRSRGRFINIIGEPTRLAAPIVESQVGGALNPDLPSVIVRIPYDPLITSDNAIEIHWSITLQDGTVFEPELDWIFPTQQEADDPDGFIVTISGPEHLKPGEGGTLVVWYEVLSEGENGEVVRRPSPPASSLNIGEPKLELVPAILLGEKDGTFEPKDLPNGISEVTCPNPVNNPTLPKDVVHWQLYDDQGGLLFTDNKPLNSLNAGKPVKFPLNAAFVQQYFEARRGEQLSIRYHIVRDATGKTSHSNPLEFTIGTAQQQPLDPAKVQGTANDELDIATVPNGTNVEIAPRATDNTGDQVLMKWATTDGVTVHEADKTVSATDKGKVIEFPIASSILQASANKGVVVSYRVKPSVGAEIPGTDYPLKVVSQAFTLPIAKFKEALGDQLNPDHVTAGATVIIDASAQLKADDEVIVTVTGQPPTTLPAYTIKPGEADKELSSIKVAHGVILAEDGNSIELTYIVKRKAGGTDGPSVPAVYDVRKVIAAGKLKVMGARHNRSVYWASRASRWLMAFDATTGKPIQAEWKYANGSTWTKGSIWLDTSPQEPLQVRTADDQLTLSEANIFGDGSDTTITGQAAFVALRDKNNMAGWGLAANGGAIPPTIITMDDIVEVSCTRSTYAARRSNNTTIAWSNTAGEGNDMSTVNPTGFTRVVGNITAFAGIKGDGTVHAWGAAANGGTTSAEVKAITNAVEVTPAGSAFAVRLATGHVKAWGVAASGGAVTSPIDTLDDIDDVLGNVFAFAAHRTNGTVVAWGHATYGGTVPAAIAGLTNITRLACANYYSFCALLDTKQVVAWGPAAQGGTVPTLIASLTDIFSVVGTWTAFAALRENGHVVAWPETIPAGMVPAAIAARDDIVQIAGTSDAFAVLYKDGTVAAWGNATVGGNTAPVAAQLTDVLAIYANTHGFTALTADGRVVTWGQAAGGGDSSTVQPPLNGTVSYLATPASRGQALMASRLSQSKTSV
ncbi:hypothetical protein [Pseudomonas moraviensis]|uniref:BIG2 domain-containing protein n=1 Tax=Pseudomonas moraviensis TaxID=321662 RepID=A0A7Y9VS22_9PSED|nr:hypothetical protein [Pseudomonas moraviensis]NYH07454.1 hypothetical protein [Pseudomonas moraviensis]